MIITSEMRSNFVRAVLDAYLGTMEKGTLGKKVPGNPPVIYVRGNAGNVWVTRQDSTVIQARVKGQISYEEGYPVEFRYENGIYVIYGRSVHPSLPVGADPTPGGNPFEWIQIITDAALPIDDYWTAYWSTDLKIALRIETLDLTHDFFTVTAGGEAMVYWGPGGFELYEYDRGNDNPGSGISIGRNNNATSAGAGFLALQQRNATWKWLHVDASGDLRIHTSAPYGSVDTSGTVVGTQTSSLDTKDVIGEPISGDEALRHIRDAARTGIRRFRFKSGALDGEEFSGVITDYAPRYGMDKDVDHPSGKSLNTINAIGDLMLAVTRLQEQIAELTARLEALSGD